MEETSSFQHIQEETPPKTNGLEGPKMMGLGKGNSL